MTELTFAQIDNTVIETLKPPPRKYWLLLLLLLAGVAVGAGSWIYQIFVGIGAGGQNHPVAWGTYLINFVFWVGIAHSGTLISAILHLFRAGWRNPIARAAETMTVFAVCIAGLFPFVHLGRVWMVYYMLPVPNERTLWPNFMSPLMFDVVAISTYLTVSSLFWYTGMLPDLAADPRSRDRAVRKKTFYSIISLGWSGQRFEQWRHHAREAMSASPALATPLGDLGALASCRGTSPSVAAARLAHDHLRALLRRRAPSTPGLAMMHHAHDSPAGSCFKLRKASSR